MAGSWMDDGGMSGYEEGGTLNGSGGGMDGTLQDSGGWMVLRSVVTSNSEWMDVGR